MNVRSFDGFFLWHAWATIDHVTLSEFNGSWTCHAIFLSGKLVWQQRNALRMFYASTLRNSQSINYY